MASNKQNHNCHPRAVNFYPTRPNPSKHGQPKAIRTPLAAKLAASSKRATSVSQQPRPRPNNHPNVMQPRPLRSAANRPHSAMNAAAINRHRKSQKPLVRLNNYQKVEVLQGAPPPTLEAEHASNQMNEANSNSEEKSNAVTPARKRALSDDQTVSESQANGPPQKRQKIAINKHSDINDSQQNPNHGAMHREESALDEAEKKAMSFMSNIFSNFKEQMAEANKQWDAKRTEYENQINTLKANNDEQLKTFKLKDIEMNNRDQELSDLRDTLQRVRAELDCKVLNQKKNEEQLQNAINEKDKLVKEHMQLKEEHINLQKRLQEQNKTFLEKTNELKKQLEVQSNEKLKESMNEKEKEWKLEKSALMKQNKIIRDERNNLLQHKQQFLTKIGELSSDSDDDSMDITQSCFDTKSFDENLYDDEKENDLV